MFHTAPVTLEGYHERVRRTAVELLPMRIDTWVGADAEVPQSAVQLLRPNVIVARRYTDSQTGRQVSFLLVHVRDMRDILGHYPPICYKSQGYTIASAVPRDLTVDELTIQLTRYQFTHKRLDRSSRVIVDNFMVLPDGRTCRDMQEVEQLARDHRTKFLGVAQLQIVYDSDLNQAERDALLDQFLSASKPLIDGLRSGVSDESQQG
jgi:hypothetical protein